MIKVWSTFVYKEESYLKQRRPLEADSKKKKLTKHHLSRPFVKTHGLFTHNNLLYTEVIASYRKENCFYKPCKIMSN